MLQLGKQCNGHQQGSSIDEMNIDPWSIWYEIV